MSLRTSVVTNGAPENGVLENVINASDLPFADSQEAAHALAGTPVPGSRPAPLPLLPCGHLLSRARVCSAPSYILGAGPTVGGVSTHVGAP